MTSHILVKMKAIQFERFGEPVDVLQVRETAVPDVGPNQVRVRMLLSPINPSDLLVVRGKYGKLPSLPATPGFEGVGVIDKAGPGFLRILRGLKPGRRVAVLNGRGGNWQEQVVLSARHVVPVPHDLPDEQVASFFINPASALVMTQWVFKVKPGDWLLQTAAGSALGRMVIRLGKHFGFRTINVVRRQEQAKEIKQLGGTEMICSSEESIEQRAMEITQGAGVPFALDAVGGSAGLGAVRSLGAGGRMLVYGLLSGEPIPVEPRFLMMGQKSIEGFWLSEWVPKQGMFAMLGLFKQITQLLQQQVLTTAAGDQFALDQIAAAVRQAEVPGRQGKVLIRLGKA
jgi:NADPH:quinone reductase-like Zn-dependent oxidoreductase